MSTIPANSMPPLERGTPNIRYNTNTADRTPELHEEDAKKIENLGAGLLGKKKLDQNMHSFLMLLTTQLKYQDPMDPMDNSEIVSQLVQFSAVEEALNTNKKLDDLIALSRMSQGIEAINFIGKEVNYEGTTFNYDGTKPQILYVLNQDVPAVRVKITDQKGQLVQSENLSGKAGKHTIAFKGVDLYNKPLEQGAYVVQVEAIDDKGNIIQNDKNEYMKVPTYLSGRVTNIEKTNDSPVLAMGLVQVPMDKILAFRESDPVQQGSVLQAKESGGIQGQKATEEQTTSKEHSKSAIEIMQSNE